MSSDNTITIRLTDQPPITIREGEWPLVASAAADWYDSEHTFQANTEWHVLLKAREHEDGRMVIYGTYRYLTNYSGGENIDVYAGVLGMLHAPDEMHRVVDQLEFLSDTRFPAWQRLTAEWIADMPVVSL